MSCDAADVVMARCFVLCHDALLVLVDFEASAPRLVVVDLEDDALVVAVPVPVVELVADVMPEIVAVADIVPETYTPFASTVALVPEAFADVEPLLVSVPNGSRQSRMNSRILIMVTGIFYNLRSSGRNNTVNSRKFRSNCRDSPGTWKRSAF